MVCSNDQIILVRYDLEPTRTKMKFGREFHYKFQISNLIEIRQRALDIKRADNYTGTQCFHCMQGSRHTGRQVPGRLKFCIAATKICGFGTERASCRHSEE